MATGPFLHLFPQRNVQFQKQILHLDACCPTPISARGELRRVAPLVHRHMESGVNMVRVNARLDSTRAGFEAEALEASLARCIVGQDEAIQQIVSIYQMSLTGLTAPGRPIGNFLFLGPTGSGKTRSVEATAESLVGSPNAVIKIDCAEFQHSHEIAKLVGSPPGYLGHRDTHPMLSQEVLNRHHTDRVKVSFLLFDEIEKASDSLWNLLLGILDKATLTLGDNRRVDFSRTMVFMTSNLGAAEMGNILSPKFGFQIAAGAPVLSDGRVNEKICQTGLEAARRKFAPEFINRLDKIVVFRPLGEAELRRILDIELRMVQQRIFSSLSPNPFVFTLTQRAKDQLLAEGVDLKYGARHLKRVIDRLLVQPISNLVATRQVRGGDWIRADWDPGAGRMAFWKEAEAMTLDTMAKVAESTARPAGIAATAYARSEPEPHGAGADA